MPLKACPECSKDVSDTVAKCPHCGFVLTKSKAKGCLKVVGIIVLIPVGILVLMFIKELIFPSGSELGDSRSWTIGEGKRSLERSLKDPDSVSYSDVWVGRLKAKPEDEGSPVACGYFNARNGFGGMSGSQRFIGAPGGIVLTDETAGGSLMDAAWRQACVTDRS